MSEISRLYGTPIKVHSFGSQKERGCVFFPLRFLILAECIFEQTLLCTHLINNPFQLTWNISAKEKKKQTNSDQLLNSKYLPYTMSVVNLYIVRFAVSLFCL